MSGADDRGALALLIWDTRRGLVRALLVVSALAAGTVALGLVAGLRAPRAGRPEAAAVSGDAAREALRRADAHRRAGRTIAALREYSAVARDPLARVDDARRARYGAARTRLDAGEVSALEELARLAESELAPHEIARARAAILRFDATEIGARARAARCAERCLEALRARAEVLDIDGDRARGWLDRVAREPRAR